MVCIDNTQYRSAFAAIAAGQHYNVVAFSDLAHMRNVLYSTSGARETIFMNRSVRNSRVTGPKIRVPIGSSF